MFKLHTDLYQAEHSQEATVPAQNSPEAWLLITVGYEMYNWKTQMFPLPAKKYFTSKSPSKRLYAIRTQVPVSDQY